MTPVRAPAIVWGDVPGLLRRGMPVLWKGPPDDLAVVFEMEPDTMPLAHVAFMRDGRRNGNDLTGRSVTIDFTDPAALYLSLHWLADRGHLCGWMLPKTHGGRVEPWDGLTAWEVAAVLVSVSVGRVAAGLGPITDLVTEACWGTAGCLPGVTRYHLVSARDQGRRYMADVGRAYGKGPRTDERPNAAARALSDGCCLQVPGGLVVPT